MRKKLYLIFLILFIIYIRKIKSELFNITDETSTLFYLNLYDKNNILKKTYELYYNPETYMFDNYDEVKNDFSSLVKNNYKEGFKTLLLCNVNDIEIKRKSKHIIEFWNTSMETEIASTLVYSTVFPIWYHLQKKKDNNKRFCFRFTSVGWNENGSRSICHNDEPCPDIIILGTTQIPRRYYQDDLMVLNKYFRNYLLKTGRSLESMFYKNTYHDYKINNNWLAVPLIADVRSFRFNKATFENCNKYFGYERLHLPPPHSDYWGPDYQKTWTWEKAVEYAKLIKECSGKNAFRINGGLPEDHRFFISVCQSLGIPFIIEDSKLRKKKCGFRDKVYQDKLSIIRELYEKQITIDWLSSDSVNKFIEETPFPNSYDNLPHFGMTYLYGYDYYDRNNGFIINGLNTRIISGILLSYFPGNSAFLGGSGITITKNSTYADEIFEYIEILIDETYPYITLLNQFITPFENIPGNGCEKKNVQKSKLELCNLSLSKDGVFPYYFAYENTTQVAYFRHKGESPNRYIEIDTQKTLNPNIIKRSNYTCNAKASYFNSTIAIAGNNDILVPINEKETILFKSMDDTNYSIDETDNCLIYEDTMRKAKPMQFPYNNFNEMSVLDEKLVITQMFARLYYSQNTTSKPSFDAIINECCDIIDHYLLPKCNEQDGFQYEFSKCDSKTQTKNITYLNCDAIDPKLPTNVTCSFIPYKNFKGIIVLSTTSGSLLIEAIFAVFVIIYRHHHSIQVSGYKFLLILAGSTILLSFSVIFWIGEIKKYKCILKIWLLVLGMTGFISSYSVKSLYIISIYNNKKMSSNLNNFKYHIFYIIMIMCQVTILSIWSFTYKGPTSSQKYKKYLGYYSEETCNSSIEYLVLLAFSLNFALLSLSIVVSYKGRDIPAQFNYSKKIFLTSIITFFLLIFCYLMVSYNFESSLPYVVILILVTLISLVINFIFIGPKVAVVLNLETDDGNKVSVVVVDSSKKSSIVSDSEKYSGSVN